VRAAAAVLGRAPSVRRGAEALAAAGARSARTPARSAALLAIPLLALLLLLLPGGDGALEREIADLLTRGDHAAARQRLDDAARAAPGDPLVEKLRGDVACARGAPGECLRRYRVALAARPAFGGDPALRANARLLLAGDHACGTRRAAAHLLGELRDPEALPTLEAARRSGGIFAFLCTGDAIERAITATRADLDR
jgi:predicted Zn-dependent protease